MNLADELNGCLSDSDEDHDIEFERPDPSLETPSTTAPSSESHENEQEDTEEASTRLKDLVHVIAEQQQLLLRQSEILKALTALVPGGPLKGAEPIPPVLKRTYSLQEDGEDDENADGHETGSETEVGEEEDAGDLPDLPELSGHSRPDAVRRHSSPIRPRPKLPSRRKTRMSERWTRSEKLERRDSLRSDSMQLGDSVNVNELMLKVYDTHHDTPLGDFIRGGIPSTRLFEGWLKSKGSTFGLQLLDLLVRNARNDGPAFDEDAAPCDCRLVDVCGNVAVTKGWKSKYALFEALKQGSRRALDDQNMFFSEFRPQRTLQIWNLTPEHAGILCSEGHILYNPYIDSFLSSHLGFNNTFELRNPIPGRIYLTYHFAYLALRYGGQSKTPRADPRSLRRSGNFPPDRPQAFLYESRRSFSLNVSVLDTRRYYNAIELGEDYYMECPGLIRDCEGRRRGRQSRWPTWFSVNTAPSFMRWLDDSFEIVVAEWENALGRLEEKVRMEEIMQYNAGELESLLFGSVTFTHSRKFFWALQSLRHFEQVIQETLNTWYDFAETDVWKSRRNLLWFEVIKEDCMTEEQYARKKAENLRMFEELEESIAFNVAYLDSLLRNVRHSISQLRMLDDKLANPPSPRQSPSFEEKASEVRLITMAAFAVIPLAVVTAMSSISFSPEYIINVILCLFLGLVLLVAPLVLNVGNLTSIIRMSFRPSKYRLRQQMRASGSPRWDAMARAFEQHELFTSEGEGPSLWWYFSFCISHPRRGMDALLGTVGGRRKSVSMKNP